MKVVLVGIARFLGKVLIGAGIDALSKKVKVKCDILNEVSDAILEAEGIATLGEDKMKAALDAIKRDAPEAAIKYSEKQLRMFIEMKLNKLL